MVEAPSWQRPSTAPVPPRGTPGGSGQLGTPRERPARWAPSRCLGCSSQPPPKPPISPPLTTQAAIRKVDPNADDKTVERMLTFADADGDDTVSLDEFKEIIRSAGVKPYFASKAAEDAKIAEAA